MEGTSQALPDPFTDGRDGLVRQLGITWLKHDGASVISRMPVTPAHLAPTGTLHGGAIVSLADSTCGYGCHLVKPAGASGFTTLDLNANFLRMAKLETVRCEARMLHGGKTTQVWEATVFDGDSDRAIALFRCVQMILYPRQGGSGTVR